MIEIDDILISDDIVSSQFVCDLTACQGGCCVEGDAGAPITAEEAKMIKDIYPHIKQDLMPKAVEEIEKNGTDTLDDEFDIVTPTIDNGICVYGYYDEHNIVKCAIEKHYLAGHSNFKKPISCHLFPIRVDKGKNHEFLNYEPRKDLCKSACKNGKRLQVPTYRFLKEPLIRAYGKDFYEVLDDIAIEHYNITP